MTLVKTHVLVELIGTDAYACAIGRIARAANKQGLAIGLPEDNLPKIIDWVLCRAAFEIGGFKMPPRHPPKGGKRVAGPGKRMGRPRKVTPPPKA